jgi:hypothetical protein
MPFWPIYLPDGRPITVRPNSEGFELIARARRYRAEQLAELFSIPAVSSAAIDLVARSGTAGLWSMPRASW